jgi:hypothetical protein
MLKTLFPDGRFSPPATEAAIDDAESQLGVQIPSQLRSLYLICDGFREDKGNTKYLFSLTNEDFIGALVTVTRWPRSNVNRCDPSKIESAALRVQYPSPLGSRTTANPGSVVILLR